jgi:hypothetical protein
LAHNFVLADERYNGAKSDMPAAIPHLRPSSERNRTAGENLARRFDQHGLLQDGIPKISLTVALAAG